MHLHLTSTFILSFLSLSSTLLGAVRRLQKCSWSQCFICSIDVFKQKTLQMWFVQQEMAYFIFLENYQLTQNSLHCSFPSHTTSLLSHLFLWNAPWKEVYLVEICQIHYKSPNNCVLCLALVTFIANSSKGNLMIGKSFWRAYYPYLSNRTGKPTSGSSGEKNITWPIGWNWYSV